MTNLRTNLFATICFAVVSTACCHGMCAEPLDSEQYEHLRRVLTPDSTELWRSIPWRISLLEAQRAAVEQQKPIFIWAMDGHPLGCT